MDNIYWAICRGDNVLASTIDYTRRDCLRGFERYWGDGEKWKNLRRRHPNLEIRKVKVEVL